MYARYNSFVWSMVCLVKKISNIWKIKHFKFGGNQSYFMTISVVHILQLDAL